RWTRTRRRRVRTQVRMIALVRGVFAEFSSCPTKFTQATLANFFLVFAHPGDPDAVGDVTLGGARLGRVDEHGRDRQPQQLPLPVQGSAVPLLLAGHRVT